MYDKRTLNELSSGRLKELFEQLTGRELHRHSDQWEGACIECGHTIFVSDREPDHFYCRTCGRRYYATDIISCALGLRSATQFQDVLKYLADFLQLSDTDTSTIKRARKTASTAPISYNTYPHQPSQEWQTEVKRAVLHARDFLWSDGGKNELDYLRNRGFTDKTIRDYYIGFIPTEYFLNVKDAKGNYIKAPAGIYIPSFMSVKDSDLGTSTLMRVKVRMENWKYMNLMKAYEDGSINRKPEKYFFITGSKAKSLFCARYARPPEGREYPNIIYTEGEFDAMTINQAAGDICRAVTFGANNYNGTAEEWFRWYTVPERTVICFDNDPDPNIYKATRNGEKKLQAEITRAQYILPPELRRQPPVIRPLPGCYKDWNDILKLPDGTQIIRNILKTFFQN